MSAQRALLILSAVALLLGADSSDFDDGDEAASSSTTIIEARAPPSSFPLRVSFYRAFASDVSLAGLPVVQSSLLRYTAHCQTLVGGGVPHPSHLVASTSALTSELALPCVQGEFPNEQLVTFQTNKVFRVLLDGGKQQAIVKRDGSFAIYDVSDLCASCLCFLLCLAF
jgi:hypothetical protein